MQNDIEELSPAIILVNPQLGSNIGAAARAMANFGLNELHIVEPRDGWPNPYADKAAVSAINLIEQAQVWETLEPAIAKYHYVYATTARPRDMTKPIITPEQAAQDMRKRAKRGEKTAILFGRERWGLSNDEIALADASVMAPVNPKHASLNIAQAVLLLGYEWFKQVPQTLGQETSELPAINAGLYMPDTRPANKQELLGLFGHLEKELTDKGFFKSEGMKPTMIRNLRNMLTRAELTEQEVRSLRGVITSLAHF